MRSGSHIPGNRCPSVHPSPARARARARAQAQARVYNPHHIPHGEGDGDGSGGGKEGSEYERVGEKKNNHAIRKYRCKVKMAIGCGYRGTKSGKCDQIRDDDNAMLTMADARAVEQWYVHLPVLW